MESLKRCAGSTQVQSTHSAVRLPTRCTGCVIGLDGGLQLMALNGGGQHTGPAPAIFNQPTLTIQQHHMDRQRKARTLRTPTPTKWLTLHLSFTTAPPFSNDPPPPAAPRHLPCRYRAQVDPACYSLLQPFEASRTLHTPPPPTTIPINAQPGGHSKQPTQHFRVYTRTSHQYTCNSHTPVVHVPAISTC